MAGVWAGGVVALFNAVDARSSIRGKIFCIIKLITLFEKII